MKKEDKHDSASVMLRVTENQYSVERQRTGSLDAKAGMFIGLIFAVLTFVFPSIPFKKIKLCLTTKNKYELCLLIDTLILLTVAVIFLVLAIYNLYSGYSLKEFSAFDTKSMCDSELLNQKESITQRTLIEDYCEAIKQNAETNDAKAILIRKGLKDTMIAFSLMLSTVVAINLIVL